jgi:hypothetical protein
MFKVRAALWELYDGRRCVGWVERVYTRGKTWVASPAAGVEERFATKAKALAGLRRLHKTGKWD